MANGNISFGEETERLASYGVRKGSKVEVEIAGKDRLKVKG